MQSQSQLLKTEICSKVINIQDQFNDARNQKEVDAIKDFLISTRTTGENALEIYFKTNDSSEVYKESMIIATPLIIFGCISFITFFLYISCCCCEKKLPKWCKRDHEKHPYQEKDFYRPLFIACILCLFIGYSACIGIVYGNEIETSMQYLHCVVISLFEEFRFGNSNGLCIAILSMVAIASGFFIHFMKQIELTFILHLTWCWYSISLTAGLYFCAILLPSSIIMAEGCEITEKALNNQKNFIQYEKIIPSTIANNLVQCYSKFENGNGKFLQQFQLDAQIEQLYLYQTSKQNITNFDDSDTINSQINSLIQLSDNNLNQFQSSSYFQNQDSNVILETSDLNQAIVNLNQYTDNYNQCTSIKFQDFYTLIELDCKQDYTYTETQFSDDSLSPQKLCININNQTKNQLLQRYTINNYQLDCGNQAYLNLQNNLISLLEFIDLKNNLALEKISQQQLFKNQNDNLLTNIQKLTNIISNYQQQIVTNIDKIQLQSNCLFIENEFDKIKKSVCQIQLPVLYFLSIIQVWMCIFLIFGTFTSFYAAIRYKFKKFQKIKVRQAPPSIPMEQQIKLMKEKEIRLQQQIQKQKEKPVSKSKNKKQKTVFIKQENQDTERNLITQDDQQQTQEINEKKQNNNFKKITPIIQPKQQQQKPNQKKQYSEFIDEEDPTQNIQDQKQNQQKKLFPNKSETFEQQQNNINNSKKQYQTKFSIKSIN